MTEIERIKQLHQEAEMPYRKVWEYFGWSESWYKKMLAGEFKDPDPKRMSLIQGFLRHAIKMKAEFEKHVSEL